MLYRKGWQKAGNTDNHVVEDTKEVSKDMLKKASALETIDVTLRLYGPPTTLHGEYHSGSEHRTEVGIVPE
jgi:hypothetical protein